ncbi:hypothetical protein DYB37_009052 [Aphanomyces astaci]|uniref:tRNA (adenine(58)-N(1))-methyltransferase n=1 Tax=Aphanomyces astaci TaxID=112090 RepID=A0A418EL33_APHAT|nr:hypothetical protein DYB37_009052 [Aphanomyces astaci]
MEVPAGTDHVAVVPTTPTFSMWAGKTIVEAGDLVILFETHNSITYAYVKPDEIYQNRHGAFHHNDIIGNRYGAKVYSRMSKGYIYILSPTPELWSKALRHRTQIVFTLDASAITFQTHCAPGTVASTAFSCRTSLHRVHVGKIVIESGTGSGALTTAFARTVAPHGHVYTFEFNATRAQVAKEEFVANGLENVVTIECRDACEQGPPSIEKPASTFYLTFHHDMAVGFPEHLAGKVDVVFLDLPCPWKAVLEYQRVKRKAVEDEVENEANKPKTVTLAKRDEEMRGHTAFLTFAYKF